MGCLLNIGSSGVLKNIVFIGVLLPASLFAADLGTTGLIDTPTARMRPDGEFAAVISKQPVVDIYSLNYQATPWLETTFRYSAFDFGLFDRSYEVKIRLLEEREFLPEVAIGIRDLLGTGVLGSEYLVSNKQIGPIDFSLGIGWGRLADEGAFRNPFTYLSDEFNERGGQGVTGTLQAQSFFSGPEVGFFGGISYQMDSPDIKILVEYNPDQYLREKELASNGNWGPTSVDDISSVSYGIEWSPTKDFTLGLSHQFGEQWAFSVSSSMDSSERSEKLPSAPYVSALQYLEAGVEAENYDFNSWYDRLLYDMRLSGLNLVEVSTNSVVTEATLVVQNYQYSLAADAVERTLTLAQANLPATITDLNVVIQEYGISPITINYRRFDSETGWVDSSGNSINILGGRELQNPTQRTPVQYGRVSLSANIGTRFQFFDPDDPLRYQLLLRLGASAPLGLGWEARGSYAVDIANSFDGITRTSNSVLPHVRSDSGLYLQEGTSGLESVYFEKRDNLASDIFYRLYGGVLEEMYSGLGGELLFQPFRSRLAFGFSANWVKQRDYDKSFNHLDYDAVTAFASVYWATPWYNYDVALHGGQYLAKDIGATLEVRRTFDNGWQVGAWATLTNVPFDEFGEGSFDKGLYFRIPLQKMLGINTRTTYTNALRSIQRDGGQRLENFSGNLWYDLRSSRYDALDNNRDRMVP